MSKPLGVDKTEFLGLEFGGPHLGRQTRDKFLMWLPQNWLVCVILWEAFCHYQIHYHECHIFLEYLEAVY